MSGLLLDTHAALFWWSNSKALSRRARDAITDAEERVVFVSAASGWEIATKFRLRKLSFAGDPAERVPRLMLAAGFRELTVTMAHGLRAGLLVGDHRDPFDRIIAAQGLSESLVVVTRDREIAAFGCEVLW